MADLERELAAANQRCVALEARLDLLGKELIEAEGGGARVAKKCGSESDGLQSEQVTTEHIGAFYPWRNIRGAHKRKAKKKQQQQQQRVKYRCHGQPAPITCVLRSLAYALSRKEMRRLS